MLVLNFSHPVTPDQQAQLETLIGEVVEVRDIRTQFDAVSKFAPQVKTLMDGLTDLPDQFIINPPAMAAISLLVMDALRRYGALRPFIRLRTVPGAAVTTFEVAEIIGWQPPQPVPPPAGNDDAPRTSPAMPPAYRAWQAAPHVPAAPPAPPAAPVAPVAPVAPKYVSPFGTPPASFVREAARKAAAAEAETARILSVANPKPANPFAAAPPHALVAKARSDAEARAAAAADIPADVREQIGSWVSTNGRYGVALVAHPRHKGEALMQGSAIVAGRTAGTDVVRVDDAVGKWVRVVEKDADSCVRGAKIVLQRDLQSSRILSVIEAPEGGAWKEYGYKRRSSQWYTVRGGTVVTLAPYEALQVQAQGQGDNAH